jgi:hypothetical protein
MISRLYWIGLYKCSNKCKWLFQVDLMILPTIGRFVKCVLAGVSTPRPFWPVLVLTRGNEQTDAWMLSHYVPFSLTTSRSFLASSACYTLALRSPGFPYNCLCAFLLGGPFLVWSWLACIRNCL